MNWSIVANVILVILLILVVVLAVLYFLGRKMEKRQVEQQSAIDAAKQTVSLMAIDKKKLKIKEAGLPPIVYEQTPWYAKWMKVPVVKAKIGTKIMTCLLYTSIASRLSSTPAFPCSASCFSAAAGSVFFSCSSIFPAESQDVYKRQ